jgi:hypothetical protein
MLMSEAEFDDDEEGDPPARPLLATPLRPAEKMLMRKLLEGKRKRRA